MIRRQFRCTLDGYRYGRYDKVPLNIPVLNERTSQASSYERNSIMVALFQRTTATNLILFLERGTTLKALRSAHLLFACDSEERGNYTIERSEAGVLPWRTNPSPLAVQLSRFSKTFWCYNAAYLGTGSTLAVRYCAPLVVRMATSMFPGQVRELREKHAWRHTKL